MGNEIEVLEQRLIKKNKELKAIANKYFKLYEDSPDMYASVDPTNAIIKDCNKTLAKKTGYIKDELLDQSIFSLYHPDCIGDVIKAFEVFIREGRVVNAELALRKKDGSKIPVLLNVEAIRDNEGKVLYSNSCFRDMSETIRLQKELEETNQKLEKRNKELEEFAYMVSHDLQSPLKTIDSLAELFKLQYKGALGSDADQYLHLITQASTRMSALIKGLLNYSLAGVEQDFTDINCITLLEGVRSDLAAHLQEAEAKLVIPENLPTLRGNETAIRLLFQNLISNAIKFRKEEVTPLIEISARKVSKYWEFRVKDNGIGMEKEHQRKIFLIFQRLNNRSKYEGSGIGLAHCQRVVDMHGGKIWVESEPQKGSCFYFTLDADLGLVEEIDNEVIEF